MVVGEEAETVGGGALKGWWGNPSMVKGGVKGGRGNQLVVGGNYVGELNRTESWTFFGSQGGVGGRDMGQQG